MTTLIEALKKDILDGTFDDSLDELEKLVQERLMEVRKSRPASSFGVGDIVRFNTFCGLKYLHGHQATVVGFRGKKLLVKLVTPTGRFARYENGKLVSSEISVPPSIIDLVK